MKEWWRYVQYVYVPAHVHTCTCVVGVGQQEISRAWECLRGKTVWEKPVLLSSQLRPLPISLQMDFLLQDWSEETSVPRLPAGHKQTGIFLDYLDQVWSLAKSTFLHKRKQT